MRIAMMSDTHGMHRQVKMPKADMLIHAGDFSNIGSPAETVDFIEWLDEQDYKHMVFVAGNHDFFPYENEKVFLELINDGNAPRIHYLKNKAIEIEGIKIYGSPITPTFNNWAFMMDRGWEIKATWDQIPSGLDILVTHGPAWGNLDTVMKGNIEWHIGCEELTQAVERTKPAIHLFGHIHDGYGKAKVGDTKLYNVSICDEAYDPCNKVTVINYKQKETTGGHM